tara:strand:+ start:417 stop:587 length:171 start_codon:yes stop_codon:yes gene_type:complete
MIFNKKIHGICHGFHEIYMEFMDFVMDSVMDIHGFMEFSWIQMRIYMEIYGFMDFT